MPSNFVPRSRHRRPARQPASARAAVVQVPQLLTDIGVACALPRSTVWQLWSALLRADDPMVVGFRFDLVLQSRRATSLTAFLLHQGAPRRCVLVIERLVETGLLTRGVASHFQEKLLALVDAHGAWTTVPFDTQPSARSPL